MYERKPEYQKPFMERNDVLRNLESKMHKKLDTYRPQPEDFIDVYSSEEIQKDVDYVTRIENKILEENQGKPGFKRKKIERINSIATITEGILIDQMSGSWLNDPDYKNRDYDIIAHPTSKYDDYRCGADLALEIINRETEQESHLGLSVDITYSSDSAIIREKLERVYNELTLDHVNKYGHPSIKYFENNAETYRGSIDIGRCVLVVDGDRLPKMFENEIRGNKDELSKDPIQFSLLMQMELQSRFFLERARMVGNESAVGIYQEILKNIRHLKQIKEHNNRGRKIELQKMIIAHKDLRLLSMVLSDMYADIDVIKKTM